MLTLYLTFKRRWCPVTAVAGALLFLTQSAGAAVDATDPSESDVAASLVKAIYTRQVGVERIMLDARTPIGHVANLDSDQLIVWFDQPRRFDLDDLDDRSKSRLIGARTGEEGLTRWLVLDLAPGSRFRSKTLEDHLVVITIEADEDRSPPVDSDVRRQDQQPSSETDVQVQGKRKTVETKKAPEQTVATTGKLEVAAAAALEVEQVAPPKPRASVTGSVARSSAPTPLMKTRVANRADAVSTSVSEAETSNPSAPASANDEWTAGSNSSLPGQFEVDAAALDRALERTLTREGAVLMPFGLFELEPSISYSRREFGAPTLINLFGFPAFGETKVRRNDYVVSLAARLGLPFDAQLELDVPFTYVDQSVMTTIGFDPINETDSDAGAFGDLGIGLAKTVLKEGAWWPDVVARVRWDSQTGKTVDNGIAFGGGTHELTGSLSLVKSQDPLAFFGTVDYEKTFEEDDLDPGDRIGVSIGTVLAASPETSLRASLRQDFIGDAEFDGDQLAGTDQMAATLNVGASMVLGRGVLLDASAEVGLTDDAPDYAARMSLPIRFNLRRAFSLSKGD